MRKAAIWFAAHIDKIVERKNAGIPADTIKQAQDQHLIVYILGELLITENSDGSHNPEMVRQSLTRLVEEMCQVRQ